MPLYIVDSNFFIEAHRINYPIDIAESYWTKVKKFADDGIIISIDKVKNELYDKNDVLEKWCKQNLPQNFFQKSETTIHSYAKVANWVYSKKDHYLPKAIDEFLDKDEADAFIIAYAMEDIKNRVIVTQEVSEPNRKNKIKIPDVCKFFQIRTINTLSLFRELGEKF
ncbi:MAG TPA: DUF4411 family protein [Leptospiraceae bacterium]|nr:DUF4411 family protein [Leptospiraceae bacterium]